MEEHDIYVHKKEVVCIQNLKNSNSTFTHGAIYCVVLPKTDTHKFRQEKSYPDHTYKQT